MHKIIAILLTSVITATFFVSAQSPWTSTAKAASPLSCKVNTIKVAKGYKLPYKGDGYHLDSSRARLLPGDTFIYTFDISSEDPQHQDTIRKVTAYQNQGSNEPVNIVETYLLNGSSCVTDSEKRTSCTFDYGFTGSASEPLYFLMKVDKEPASPSTSTLFNIETDSGTATCASFIFFTEPEIPTNAEVWPDLNEYNLSFESDPIRKWWPTAPDSVQQINAALWKDSDDDNVKKFTDLQSEWQVDPYFLEITDTNSSYFSRCPIVAAGNRPCIYLTAHAVTKNPGDSYITLRATDNQTGRQTWNSYPLKIYTLSDSDPSPIPSTYAVEGPAEGEQNSADPTPIPEPSFIPKDQVTAQQFENIQQDVLYLQEKVEQQEQELGKVQKFLDRISIFFERLFRFQI